MKIQKTITVPTCVAAHAVMVLLGIAALAKATDLQSFAISLSTWGIVPDSWLITVSVVIVTAELLLAGVWLLGISRRKIAVSTAALIGLFTIVYVWRVVLGDSPKCNCFGRILAFESEKNSANWIVLRNIVLFTVLILHATLNRTRDPRSGHGTSEHEPGSLRCAYIGARRGFTLIEILIAMAIIAVLIAISIPTLAMMRVRSVTSGSLSNLRQHAIAFHAYTTDWSDTLPRFIRPDGTHDLSNAAGGTNPFSYPFQERYPYFSQSVFWPFALLQSGSYQSEWNAEIFYIPGANRLDPHSMSDINYQYTATAVSSPAFWRETTRTGPSQWVGVRISDVRYPSNKVLLSAEYEPRQGGPIQAHLGLMDASAESMDPSRMEPPYPTGEGPFDGRWSPIPGSPIGSHTIGGVHGRDFTTR